MKKIFLLLIALTVLFVSCMYILIPAKLVISSSALIETTPGGFDSCLHNLKKWAEWWPGKKEKKTDDSTFNYNGYSYRLLEAYTDGGKVVISSGKLSLATRIQTISRGRDSLLAEWAMLLPTSNNPITKLTRYLEAGSLKKNMEVAFDSLCSYAGQTKNIYGFPIQRTTFTEVTMIAFRFTSKGYPTTGDIYHAIAELRKFIASENATEKYYPMIDTKKKIAQIMKQCWLSALIQLSR